MRLSKVASWVGVGCVVMVHAASAQSADSSRGAAVLDAALVAHGGRARLDAVSDVTVDFVAQLRLMGQSRAPEPPMDVKPARAMTTYDVRRDRLVQLAENTYPPDVVLRFRQVERADSSFNIDLDRNFQGRVVDRASAEPFAAQRAVMLRELPAWFVANAREHARIAKVREAADGPSTFDVIDMDDGGGSVSAWFDRRTHLLGRLETHYQHSIGGAIDAVTKFGDYTTVRGIRLPASRVDMRNGEWAQRGPLAWSLDKRPADSLFSLPRGYVYAAPDTATFRTIAPGVHVVRTPFGHFVMAVEFRDYLAVIEAPLNSAASEAVIATLAHSIPGKPVKYVAFTHHHSDHAGGLRPYIARGVTVLSTPRYTGFVNEMAHVQYPLRPDSQSKARRPPVIAVIDGKRTITDGSMTLVLYDGPDGALCLDRNGVRAIFARALRRRRRDHTSRRSARAGQRDHSRSRR